MKKGTRCRKPEEAQVGLGAAEGQGAQGQGDLGEMSSQQCSWECWGPSRTRVKSSAPSEHAWGPPGPPLPRGNHWGPGGDWPLPRMEEFQGRFSRSLLQG